MTRVDILGVCVDAITARQATSKAVEAMKAGQKLPIFTINTEFIMRAQTDLEFRRILSTAGLALPDGIGLLWASAYLQQEVHVKWMPARSAVCFAQALSSGSRTLLSPSFRTKVLPERVTGVDLSYQLAQECAREGLKIFLLGEKQGVAEQVAKQLTSDFPQLKITGAYAGDGSQAGDSQTRQQISTHPADLLLVAYGAPKQEYWIHRNLPTIPVSVAMGVGGTFLYLSGQAKRAPVLWRRFGLEWLYRLLSEPWRYHRQLALPRFIWEVIRSKVKNTL